MLIERSTRHLRLTDAGLLLQRHARRIMDDVGEAENAIGGLVGKPRGDLRVSVPFTFAAGPLAPMLPGFMARYPGGSRDPERRQPEHRPAHRGDRRRDPHRPALQFRADRTSPGNFGTLALRPAPPIWPREVWPAEPVDLGDHIVIAHSERQRLWRFTSHLGRVIEILLESVAVVPEPAVLRTMLTGGAGIGWLPDFHAVDPIAEGSLVRVLPEWGERQRGGARPLSQPPQPLGEGPRLHRRNRRALEPCRKVSARGSLLRWLRCSADLRL